MPVREFCVKGLKRTLADKGKTCYQCKRIHYKNSWYPRNRDKISIENMAKRRASGIMEPGISRRKSICTNGHVRTSDIIGKNCRECHRIKSIERYRKNKDEFVRLGIHRQRNWRRMGILNSDGLDFTVQDYNRAFQIHGGMCKGCGIHQSQMDRSLCVDHNHFTGKFRGLLCHNCNTILGRVEDKKEILENLIKYILENEVSPRGK